MRFTDILDQSLGKATVKATSIDDPDGENVLTKNQFTVGSDGYHDKLVCVELLLTCLCLF